MWTRLHYCCPEAQWAGLHQFSCGIFCVNPCFGCCDLVCSLPNVPDQTDTFITSAFSLQAKKKGVNQTVIGLIFGCYAVCNLIGSLILGRYVSIWNDPLRSHTQNAACFNLPLCHDVRLFRLVRSSCWWWGSLCRPSAPSSSGRCWLSGPCYWSWCPQKLFFC